MMLSKLGGESPAKRVCSIKEAVEYLLKTDDELSELTKNLFSDSDTDSIESEQEESGVLSEVETVTDYVLFHVLCTIIRRKT